MLALRVMEGDGIQSPINVRVMTCQPGSPQYHGVMTQRYLLENQSFLVLVNAKGNYGIMSEKARWRLPAIRQL